MPFVDQETRAGIDATLNTAMETVRSDLGEEVFFKPGTLAYIVYRLMTLFAHTGTWGNFVSPRWRDHQRVWADVVLGGAGYYKTVIIDAYEAQAETKNGPIDEGWPDDYGNFDDEFIPF